MEEIGTYEIYEEIGHGSMGVVRKSINTVTQNELCVKILKKSVLESPINAEFFRREVEILKSLHHPNIVEYVDLLENDNYYYLFQEFCPGVRLTKYINDNIVISDKKIDIIFRQIFSALNYIHKAGIGHRDLKPDNIIVNIPYKQRAPRNGIINNITVKVIDFGLSTNDNSRMRTTFCGSLAYAAPECIRREPYIAWKADIWSTGVMLYQCCTRKMPWDTKNLVQTMRQIVTGNFTIPKIISPQIRDVIERCMKQNPGERPSAEELLKLQIYSPIIEQSDSSDSSSPKNVTKPKEPRPIRTFYRNNSNPLFKIIPPKVRQQQYGKITTPRIRHKSFSMDLSPYATKFDAN